MSHPHKNRGILGRFFLIIFCIAFFFAQIDNSRSSDQDNAVQKEIENENSESGQQNPPGDTLDNVDTLAFEATPFDTANPPPGMELLPVNVKKTKFAWFDTTKDYNRIIKHNAFDTGEKLTFIIRYGPIVAGTATMAIPKVKKVNGFECYHIQSVAKSNSFFSAFFKVRDQVDSFMDKDGLFSWRFEKRLREGNYRSNQIVELDHIDRIAVTNKKDTLRIPPCVQDILSAFYYVRTLPMEIGKSLFIDNQADRKLYPLEVRIHKKERIKVRAGTFDCIVVEPMLRSDALFKQRGRLKIWMTGDNRRIPVQMKSKILIGSITAELEKMEGTLPVYEQAKL
jgi:hypothetical protein